MFQACQGSGSDEAFGIISGIAHSTGQRPARGGDSPDSRKFRGCFAHRALAVSEARDDASRTIWFYAVVARAFGDRCQQARLFAGQRQDEVDL